MQFHTIASTGRTATTFLARALDSFEGIAAVHEGHRDGDKDTEPVLPLLNLENRAAYQDRHKAIGIVAEKRGKELVASVCASEEAQVLIDVGYYNSVLAEALLDHHEGLRIVGVIRDLEGFVRSATAMEGEDPLPVGWPDPAKPLSTRERFIGMGRLKPVRGTEDAGAWDGWSAIMRNIWLWRETNALLLDAKARHPQRVLLLPFEELKADPEGFFGKILNHFDQPQQGIARALEIAKGYENRKKSGYQVGPLSEWSEAEKAFAQDARAQIGF